jgi:hypothetical protein
MGMLRPQPGQVLWSLMALVIVTCAPATGRYVMQVDPASRYGFAHAFDRDSGKWVYRDCELRVAEARAVGELSVQLFHPGSAQSGGVQSTAPAVRDGYRVWSIADALERSDFDGRTAYGVQADHDPMELIRLAPLTDAAPGTWSGWQQASDLREGAFGWWEEAQGAPRDTRPRLPEHPFEIRCRLLLNETPSVP